LATSVRYQRRIVSGCHDAGDGHEVTTAKDVPFHGETASLVVGQAQSSRAVPRAEDAVLLEQVVEDCLLVSSDPIGFSHSAGNRLRRVRGTLC